VAALKNAYLPAWKFANAGDAIANQHSSVPGLKQREVLRRVCCEMRVALKPKSYPMRPPYCQSAGCTANWMLNDVIESGRIDATMRISPDRLGPSMFTTECRTD
jgi:hypothetical protein